MQGRCRCGAVAFEVEAPAELFAPEQCRCALHLGRGGPPFLVNVLLPLSAMQFARGFELSGALVDKDSHALIPENADSAGRHLLCSCCGDTLITDVNGVLHVFGATFSQHEAAFPVNLLLWVSGTGERTVHGGVPVRTQEEAEHYFDAMKSPPA